MEAFIEKFSRKYNLPAADCLRLIGLMERRVFRKGECVVRQGERNSDFYVVSRGIWLGRYCNDGADVSVWFAGEGEARYRSCSSGHHHHLVCRSCGRTVEVRDAKVERWAARVGAEHGFTEISHTLEVFGRCAQCAGAER